MNKNQKWESSITDQKLLELLEAQEWKKLKRMISKIYETLANSSPYIQEELFEVYQGPFRQIFGAMRYIPVETRIALFFGKALSNERILRNVSADVAILFATRLADVCKLLRPYVQPTFVKEATEERRFGLTCLLSEVRSPDELCEELKAKFRLCQDEAEDVSWYLQNAKTMGHKPRLCPNCSCSFCRLRHLAEKLVFALSKLIHDVNVQNVMPIHPLLRLFRLLPGFRMNLCILIELWLQYDSSGMLTLALCQSPSFFQTLETTIIRSEIAPRDDDWRVFVDRGTKIGVYKRVGDLCLKVLQHAESCGEKLNETAVIQNIRNRDPRWFGQTCAEEELVEQVFNDIVPQKAKTTKGVNVSAPELYGELPPTNQKSLEFLLEPRNACPYQKPDVSIPLRMTKKRAMSEPKRDSQLQVQNFASLEANTSDVSQLSVALAESPDSGSAPAVHIPDHIYSFETPTAIAAASLSDPLTPSSGDHEYSNTVSSFQREGQSGTGQDDVDLVLGAVPEPDVISSLEMTNLAVPVAEEGRSEGEEGATQVESLSSMVLKIGEQLSSLRIEFKDDESKESDDSDLFQVVEQLGTKVTPVNVQLVPQMSQHSIRVTPTAQPRNQRPDWMISPQAVVEPVFDFKQQQQHSAEREVVLKMCAQPGSINYFPIAQLHMDRDVSRADIQPDISPTVQSFDQKFNVLQAWMKNHSIISQMPSSCEQTNIISITPQGYPNSEVPGIIPQYELNFSGHAAVSSGDSSPESLVPASLKQVTWVDDDSDMNVSAMSATSHRKKQEPHGRFSLRMPKEAKSMVDGLDMKTRRNIRIKSVPRLQHIDNLNISDSFDEPIHSLAKEVSSVEEPVSHIHCLGQSKRIRFGIFQADPPRKVQNGMKFVPLNYEKESDRIQESIHDSPYGIDYSFLRWNVEVLSDNPAHIVHLSTHGSQDELWIEHKGSWMGLNAESMAHLKPFWKECKLMFLSYCHSQGTCGLLLKETGIKHMIAIDKQFRILDDLIIEFAYHFYKAFLKQGHTVREAFDRARIVTNIGYGLGKNAVHAIQLLPADGNHDVTLADILPGDVKIFDHQGPRRVEQKAIPEHGVFAVKQCADCLHEKTLLGLTTLFEPHRLTNCLVYYGANGVGKRTIVNNLASRAYQEKKCRAGVCCLRFPKKLESVEECWAELRNALQKMFGPRASQVQPSEYSISLFLKELTQQGNFALFLVPESGMEGMEDVFPEDPEVFHRLLLGLNHFLMACPKLKFCACASFQSYERIKLILKRQFIRVGLLDLPAAHRIIKRELITKMTEYDNHKSDKYTNLIKDFLGLSFMKLDKDNNPMARWHVSRKTHNFPMTCRTCSLVVELLFQGITNDLLADLLCDQKPGEECFIQLRPKLIHLNLSDVKKVNELLLTFKEEIDSLRLYYIPSHP